VGPLGVTAAPWPGRRVLVTGHTGFKGAWLSSWLHQLGAEVHGLALPPEPGSGYEVCGVADRVASVYADVRDAAAVAATMARVRPAVVFHLAAQALVRRSYDDPVGTFATNVLGTAHVLDAVRGVGGVRVIVVVTSDKCYRPVAQRAHAEDDALGGHDPYSASKACAEIVTEAWGRSFLGPEVGLATVRAGNVIGGGDRGVDRLVPDVIRALEEGRPVRLRHPDALRPFQYVLEPLQGYLMLAERLLEDPRKWSGPWNLGPAEAAPVRDVVDHALAAWGSGSWIAAGPDAGKPEAPVLVLDSRKARQELGWAPRLTLKEAVTLTVEWYRRAKADPGGARRVMAEQLAAWAGVPS
jgi:CDP-glucose 4,6-dehydratase